MAMTMKAFVMHGIGEVGIFEKPVPRPGPSDANLMNPFFSLVSQAANP